MKPSEVGGYVHYDDFRKTEEHLQKALHLLELITLNIYAKDCRFSSQVDILEYVKIFLGIDPKPERVIHDDF